MYLVSSSSRCVSTSSCSRRDRRLLFTPLDVSDDSTCGPSVRQRTLTPLSQPRELAQRPGRTYVRGGGSTAVAARYGVCTTSYAPARRGVPCGTWRRLSAGELLSTNWAAAAMADLDAELALFQAELGALTDDTSSADPPSQPTVRHTTTIGRLSRAVGM
jgi:hypothetical protein